MICNKRRLFLFRFYKTMPHTHNTLRMWGVSQAQRISLVATGERDSVPAPFEKAGETLCGFIDNSQLSYQPESSLATIIKL